MESNPLYRLIVQLNDRVDQLSNKLNNSSSVSSSSSSTDVSDLLVRIRELENRPSLENLVNDLSNSIQTLKNENQELRTQLEALNKFEAIEGRLYNLEVEPKVNIEPLNNRVNSLENNGLLDRVSNLEIKVINIEQYTNTIPDLTYRLADVERKPELSQRLDAVETMVANLNLGGTPQ